MNHAGSTDSDEEPENGGGADESQASDDVAEAPEGADNVDEVNRFVPEDIRSRYEVFSYRHAAAILASTYPGEFAELCEALRSFSLKVAEITKPGGNESEIPKKFSALLRPTDWFETRIRGDLVISREVHRPGAKKTIVVVDSLTKTNYLDGHKVDYVKNGVAFDLEWNSKDQTFDRDLYAFSAFSDCGLIGVGVLVTRSAELNEVFQALGEIVGSDGKKVLKRNGKPKLVKEKYGASTTWMGKLLYRLNTGRNGSCPVLAIGIRSQAITDWSPS